MMEEFNKYFEEAKKAKKGIDVSMNKLLKMQSNVKQSKDKESIAKINNAVNRVKELKKELDEHNS